jgi:N-acetylglucosaminyl-diphospho-decaprenol L-rhamnosyltransferase
MAPAIETVVVDNASTDRTVPLVRSMSGVKVIANRGNVGFAAAVNQGVRESGAELLLLLNPDVRLLTEVASLAEAADQHGLAAGRLVDDMGRDQKGFTVRRFPTPGALVLELSGLNRLWPSNPVNRSYRCLDRDLGSPGPVEQPAGAFLMFRREVWERLGGFDEDFFPVWFEDVDFCRRAASAGYRIEYVPSVAGEHRGGHSVRQLSQARRSEYWCDSLLTYAFKHFRLLGYQAVCLAVVLTSVPRMVAGIIRDRSLSPVGSCTRIIRFAGWRLVFPRAKPTSATTPRQDHKDGWPLETR